MSEKIEKIKQRIRKYLELENVSVLAGAGTSYHLGAPTIRNIQKLDGFPPDVLKKLKARYFQDSTETSNKNIGIGSLFRGRQKQEDASGKNAEISFEDLINCLQADRFLKQKKEDKGGISEIDEHIRKLQNYLLKKCDIEFGNLDRPDSYDNDENLPENKYFYHEMMIKKFLQRPNNLRRVNLFTTNYDMAFDYALDNLGVHYINGFMGVHNRFFKPEVYNYDLYYPGQSVSGKVHRAEKVLKYYKLHGSLSWLSTKLSVRNTYGIREFPLTSTHELTEGNELIIYPCATKQSFALGLPYSELFRHFSQAINQPQSVLFCIGYSFYDEHINTIINQALSIPSFTLIIVNYDKKKRRNVKIEFLRKLQDKRIIVVSEEAGEQRCKFTEFVKNILPELYEEEENKVIEETRKKIHPVE